MHCSPSVYVLLSLLVPAIAVQPGVVTLRGTTETIARPSTLQFPDNGDAPSMGSETIARPSTLLFPDNGDAPSMGSETIARPSTLQFPDNGDAPIIGSPISDTYTNTNTNTNAPSCSIPSEIQQKPESPTHDGSQRLFLGYRGTTHRVAQVYRTMGLVGAVANGNPTSLGEGVYLTDDIHNAGWFAEVTATNNNEHAIGGATRQRGASSQPSICTIYAKDATHFTDRVPKVFLPPSGWPNAYMVQEFRMPQILADQARWIQAHVPQLRSAVDAGTVIKFTNQNVAHPLHPESANQMMIPPAQLEHFSIGTCVDYYFGERMPDLGLPTLNNPENKLDYRLKLEEWNIHGMVDDEELA